MSPLSHISRTLRWSAWSGCEAGLEHVEVRFEGGDLVMMGVVIGETETAPFGLSYRLVVDSAWYVREAHLRSMSGERLDLASDARGMWRENGRARPDLANCTDIDISATPLTNTLPIRRLSLARGEDAAIRLVYVRVPALTAEPCLQRYTALDPGALYRFESLDSAFVADLPVDADGFLLDYPGLFKRIG